MQWLISWPTKRAHRDPTFSESKRDEDERDERETNELGTKRKLHLFANDSFSEGNASAVDSAMDTPGKIPI